MNLYGMTKKKIIHVITDDNRNGCNGYWYAACGKWIMPAEVTETMPENGRMCPHRYFLHLFVLPIKEPSRYIKVFPS